MKHLVSKAARVAAIAGVLGAGLVPVVHAQNVDGTATTTTRADGDRDYGWIGLLGLIGLAGLVRRDRSAHSSYQAAASRP